MQKPVNPQLKRVLKSAKKVKDSQQVSYPDIVDLFNSMPYNKCKVTDFQSSPKNVKKGIDRAIRKCGYNMTSHIKKGEVLIKKGVEEEG